MIANQIEVGLFFLSFFTEQGNVFVDKYHVPRLLMMSVVSCSLIDSMHFFFLLSFQVRACLSLDDDETILTKVTRANQQVETLDEAIVVGLSKR